MGMTIASLDEGNGQNHTAPIAGSGVSLNLTYEVLDKKRGVPNEDKPSHPVEQGEEVTITRHGKEVARLVPVRHGFNRDEARAAIQRIRERGQRQLCSFDWAAIASIFVRFGEPGVLRWSPQLASAWLSFHHPERSAPF
jgi:antitoxin (DNA-binding transcriptional repressor) of toxin-antitoxin stability system